MRNEHVAGNRRRSVRVAARGRVVIQGAERSHGKIVDVSATGVKVRIAGPHGACEHDDRVDLELRFDGAQGGWWRLRGRIVRVDLPQIVIELEAPPIGFVNSIGAELLAAIEGADVLHVLLVDPLTTRRARTATMLRSAGRRVTEAATPLDAIDRLGESGAQPRVVAIADTRPARIADDLRDYMRHEHGDLALVRMIAGAR